MEYLLAESVKHGSADQAVGLAIILSTNRHASTLLAVPGGGKPMAIMPDTGDWIAFELEHAGAHKGIILEDARVEIDISSAVETAYSDTARGAIVVQGSAYFLAATYKPERGMDRQMMVPFSDVEYERGKPEIAFTKWRLAVGEIITPAFSILFDVSN